MFNYDHLFLITMSLTIIIETSVLFWGAKKLLKLNVANSQLFFCGFICTFATIPYLWFVLPTYITSYWPYVVTGETLIVLMETLMIHFILTVDYKRAFQLSFLANLISYVIGLLLNIYVFAS